MADPFEALLADGLDAPVPEALGARVDAAVRGVSAAINRRWLVVRTAAAALGFAFAVHGYGNLVRGEWIAGNLHETYDSHPYNEGGLALLGLAVLLLAAAARPRWLRAALVASPVAAVYGGFGLAEAGDFLEGGLLHITEGVLGLALAGSWLSAWRYVSRGRSEGET